MFAHTVTDSYSNAILETEGHAGPECPSRNSRSNCPANQDHCPLRDSDTFEYSYADPDTYEYSDADPHTFTDRSSHGILERSPDNGELVG